MFLVLKRFLDHFLSEFRYSLVAFHSANPFCLRTKSHHFTEVKVDSSKSKEDTTNFESDQNYIVDGSFLVAVGGMRSIELYSRLCCCRQFAACHLLITSSCYVLSRW